MGLLSYNKEKKTQLYFRDDNKFQFIKRPLEYSCLLEKDGDRIKRGWPHFHCNQFFFPGYRNISADSVTLGFSRDIILDPDDTIPKGEDIGKKPKTEGDSIKKWIAKIAENQRHIYRTKRQSNMAVDRVSVTIIVVIILTAIGWLIKFATG